MVNGGMLEMDNIKLKQEQIDELNAIFGLNRRGKRKRSVLVWESALATCDLGEYQVIPLTSSWALQQEGREMGHCVGSYDRLCAKGIMQVFSIRDSKGVQVATMSLTFKDDYWFLDQIKGRENAEVCMSEEELFVEDRTETIMEMTELHYVAYEVLMCYRKAWEANLIDLIADAAQSGSSRSVRMIC